MENSLYGCELRSLNALNSGKDLIDFFWKIIFDKSKEHTYGKNFFVVNQFVCVYRLFESVSSIVCDRRILWKRRHGKLVKFL